MKAQKQRITTIAIIVIVAIAAITILPSVLTMILSFLLAGSLPGIPFVIGPSVMFVGTVLLLAYFVGHILITTISSYHPAKRSSARTVTSKLPTRRFHRI